ncbi:MAG: DUF2156 domain-containing protein [Acidobacteria bacterium]|nr:DUF2156 domain-containing protein [Acidobacteriota bacterium]
MSISSRPIDAELSPLEDVPPALRPVRRLILRYGWNATVYQILNPGIERWISDDGDAVVGFVTAHGHRVVAGAPVCADDRLHEVVAEFEADTARRRLRTCYFGAGERLARALAARGPYDRLYLGAQPCWDPRNWPAIIEGKASLRAQLLRARNKGVTVTRWSATDAKDHPELGRCLEEWLDTRGLPPLHFLIEPDTLGRLWDRLVLVAQREGRPVGFLVASPIPQRHGWLVEQNIRGAEAPNGTTELLLDAAMRAFVDHGSTYATLGLCPLSRRADVRLPPQRAWLRFLLGWVRAHGRRFYDFDGLDAYKAKFLPESWEPIYAITGGSRVGLYTLYAIAGAFGQMPPPRLVAQATLRAAGQELRWLRRRLFPQKRRPPR